VNKHTKIVAGLMLCFSTILSAQVDTVGIFNFSAYAEVYYSYDFANPNDHEKPNFIYNHKRHNEVNGNLFVLKGNYTERNIRANLALMSGNYAQYNLSPEPTWAQFMYEANIGAKLSKKHSLWLDAGIMPSHIGFESAISADCWTLTRSILAENSPYYETGVKLSYVNSKENLSLALLVLNGWQRIQRLDHNQQPSIGFQFNYKPLDFVTINYSNFIGTVLPDSLDALRSFHNFYLQFEPKSKFSLLLGFDIGTDKFNSTDYGIWYSPVAIIRYAINNKTRIAVRGEYYNDKQQIIIPTNTTNGFQVSSLSANLDFKINKNTQFRIEGKVFQSKDNIFLENQNQNYSITTNLTIRL